MKHDMKQNIEKIIESIKSEQQHLMPSEDTKQILLKSFGSQEKYSFGQYWYAAAAVSTVALAFFWLYSKSVRPSNTQGEVAIQTEKTATKIEEIVIKTLTPDIKKKQFGIAETKIKRIAHQKIILQSEMQFDILTANDADIAATFYRKNPNITWEIETEDTLLQAPKVFWDIEK
jgi:hypothetical protein